MTPPCPVLPGCPSVGNSWRWTVCNWATYNGLPTSWWNFSPHWLCYTCQWVEIPILLRHQLAYRGTLIIQAEGAIEFAATGNTPYTLLQVVDIAFQLIFQTGMLNENCKLWKRRYPADKTCTVFKIVFSTAHQELLDPQATTVGAGYHAANHVNHQATNHVNYYWEISSHFVKTMWDNGNKPM